jgi:hypothetical protein
MLSLVLFCPIPPCNQKTLVTFPAVLILLVLTVTVVPLSVLTVTLVPILIPLKPLGFPEGRSDQ